VSAVWPFEPCYDLDSLSPLGRYGIEVVVQMIYLELDGVTHDRFWYVPMERYLVFIQRSENFYRAVYYFHRRSMDRGYYWKWENIKNIYIKFMITN
jgi:hypothetical protein